MNIKNIFKDRYNILVLVLTIAMSILVFNLAKLTIVKGEHYRLEADTKRIRKVPITAARGEIRDRNGKLIAGNKPIFTVQLLKDELKQKEPEERNQHILELARLLEEDGAGYLDEFPIGLNVIRFRQDRNDIQPVDHVVELMEEHNLLPELMNSYYKEPGYDKHYTHIPARRVLQILQAKGKQIPIDIFLTDTGVNFVFEEGKNIEAWKTERGLDQNLNPYQSLMQLALRDTTLLRELLEHPISRKLVFESLERKGLAGDLEMVEYNLIYDEEYNRQKSKLMSQFKYVTKDTSGEEDFLNIFKEVSLRNFLEQVAREENIFGREKYFSYGEKLVDMVRKKDRDFKMSVDINEKEGTVNYSYKGSDKSLKGDGLDILIARATELKLVDDFLKREDVRGPAQTQLLRDGVNTKISVTEGYEYSFLNEKKSLYKQNKIDLDASAKKAFDILKEKDGVDKSLSKYEARAILGINHSLKTQGYMGYKPINISYGIDDKTVAKIEEGMADVPGIDVSIEPVRYYPEGEAAAHILGYLGRISQQGEIENYVEEKGYSKNDIIGKTGIEQSFEDQLRGQNGAKNVEIDVLGNTTRVVSEEKPIPGNNLYLSIDLDVQKKAEEKLKETLEKLQVSGTYQGDWGNYKFGGNKGRPYRYATSGATVAVNVKTGEVIALASYPAYDPNLFSTGISSSDWESLFPENEDDQLAPRPLYNIATQTAVQPGSTFKMITGLSALEKGLSPDHKIVDRGYVQIGDKPFRCWLWSSGRTHGAVDIHKALQDSCNYYFYSLMLGMDQRGGQSLGMQVDIDDLSTMAKKFGLNDKTGIEINIPAERQGGVPNPETKELGMKNMMKNFLRNNINKYRDKAFNEEELEAKVEEIASWIDRDELMTKSQVVRELSKLGIDGEKRLEGDRNDLADHIKYTYLNQAKWNMVDSLNASIGQGHGEYTPIQMANMLAGLTNGGYKNKLTTIDSIKNYNNSETILERKLEREKIDLNDPNNLKHIMEGMRRVASASSIFSGFPVEVGAKTGTAEKDGISPTSGEKYDNFAWYVTYGPQDDPEIAVATVIFQGGLGAHAGPMSRDIMAEYLGFNEEIEEKEDELPFKNTLAK